MITPVDKTDMSPVFVKIDFERGENFGPQPLIELIFMISSQEMVVEEVVVKVEIVAT